jgi:hypothetical protein
MLHHKVRAAKKFKLEFDDELQEYYVHDEFSGKQKTVAPYDGYSKSWKFREAAWRKYGGVARRFLESNVGRNWDDVNADIARRLKHESPDTYAQIRRVVRGLLKTYVMVDGVPGYHWKTIFYPAFDGSLFVNPETNILEKVKRSKKKREKSLDIPDRFGKMQKVVRIKEDLSFVRINQYVCIKGEWLFEAHRWEKRTIIKTPVREREWKWTMKEGIDSVSGRKALVRSYEPVYTTVIRDVTHYAPATKKEIREYKLNVGEENE